MKDEIKKFYALIAKLKQAPTDEDFTIIRHRIDANEISMTNTRKFIGEVEKKLLKKISLLRSGGGEEHDSPERASEDLQAL